MIISVTLSKPVKNIEEILGRPYQRIKIRAANNSNTTSYMTELFTQKQAFHEQKSEQELNDFIEKHDPELFERIKKQVKDGKWHIMGGWYLQPDCVMPCGESFIRQIETGISYFKEKFGVRPLTAINFDPFGHTRGLVQILKATGYDSYLFMRPQIFRGDFIWEGFDGSRILAHGCDSYNTLKGCACVYQKPTCGGADICTVARRATEKRTNS